MEKKKLYAIAVLLASLIVISVALLSLAIPKTEMISEPAGSYTENSAIKVTAVLKPNTLYGTTTTLDNPNEIYSNITKSLNFTESYSYSSTNMSTSNLVLKTTIVLVSTTPSWEKTIYENTTTKTISDNWPYVTIIPVNVTDALQIAASIDQQLGYNEPDPQVTILVNTTSYPGDLEPITDGFTLGIRPNLFVMNYEDAVISMAFTKDVPSDPPFYIPLDPIVAYVLIAAGAVAMAYPLDYAVRSNLLKHPRKDPVKSFLRKVNRSMIVEVDKGPGEKALPITDPFAILKLANIFESPVFLVRSMSVIYTEKEDRQYYSVIRK